MLKHATISEMTLKTLKRLAHDFETEARMLGDGILDIA